MDEEEFNGIVDAIVTDANLFQLMVIVDVSARAALKRLETPPHGDLSDEAKHNALAHMHSVLSSANIFKASRV